ncbi:transglycosylase SLT domain-containing protein [Nitrosomonas halophila]|uniref:Sel1 repeat-containing protein n=1 Tax=Nitrosomonas halophila TaxID=44576 RepID=A0A1H3CYH4_9PROT|nr:transglycosylase SLT domain-containing protein [Nitrosomonas halophila]SDX59167.1 Sel1 repeat-containing protein [Nitrosomonas halophila]
MRIDSRLLAIWLGCLMTSSLALAQDKETPPSQITQDIEMLVAEARRHEHGEGVPQDREKALELYCRAAQRGSAEGQYALGWMYANGRGVARNDNIAAQLLTMAAAQEHLPAKKLLQIIPPPDETKTHLPDCWQTHLHQPAKEFYVSQPVFALVQKLAPQYQIDPHLVLAVISVESAFNTQAVSAKNAQGLMQLIPATAERFQVKDAFDPEENIKGGMAYLRWLLAFFQGDVALVAAAYNAGEGAVEKHGGIPPYPETIDYVEKILGRYQKTTHPYQPEAANRTAFIFTRADH